jgi:hypothetical protein
MVGEFPMLAAACDECTRLLAAYGASTAERMGAEADLAAAVFSHDSRTTKVARRRLRWALGKWRLAKEKFEGHQRGHVLTAGAHS